MVIRYRISSSHVSASQRIEVSEQATVWSLGWKATRYQSYTQGSWNRSFRDQVTCSSQIQEQTQRKRLSPERDYELTCLYLMAPRLALNAGLAAYSMGRSPDPLQKVTMPLP